MFSAATTAQLSRWWSQPYGLPAGQATTSNSINYSYLANSQSSVSYVGPDSSNRPVFFFAYANTSNLLRAQMWRIENDGTITVGAEQNTSGTESVSRTIQTMSEYEGASSFGGGSGSYVYLGYNNNAATAAYGQVASINQDALTCTFGTRVTLQTYLGTVGTNQTMAAYVGSSSAVFGNPHAANTSPSIRRYTRSGTTLTAAGTWQNFITGGIDNAQLGFQPSGSQYRSANYTTDTDGAGVAYGAVTLDTVNNSSGVFYLANPTVNVGCNLNNTDKYLGGSYTSPNLDLTAISVTWGDLVTAPTFSVGSAVTLTDISGSGAAWSPVSGFTSDTAYIVYNSSASTIDYRPVTTSGTTVSLGSKTTMIGGLSNFNSQLSATSATISTKTYLSGVQVRTSGAPYIFGYRLS